MMVCHLPISVLQMRAPSPYFHSHHEMVPKLQRRWFCIYDSDDEIGELLVMATMTAVMTMDVALS